MALPYWLLKLLPLFEYICPKCRRNVTKNSHECTHCGEHYGVALRVPPRVLKDPKALEQHVHKHVFPKISVQQREYLTRFFTLIFSSGFESGGFASDGWTSYTTAGETANVVNDDKHHGTWSAKFTSDGGGGVEYAVCYRTGYNLAEAYARCYVKVTQHGLADQDDRVAFLGFVNQPQTVAMAMMGWYYDAGAVKWYIRAYNAAAWVYAYSTSVSRNLNQWYCIELYWKLDAAAGICRGWVDGQQIAEITGLDSNDYGNIDLITCGLYYLLNAGASTNYLDCFVVSDQYIGPEILPLVTVIRNL